MKVVIFREDEGKLETRMRLYYQDGWEVGDKVMMLNGEGIRYGQDHSWRRGVEENITFKVERVWPDQGVWLKAPGYGGVPYKNGPILVYFDEEGRSTKSGGYSPLW